MRPPPAAPTALLASWLVRVLSSTSRLRLDAESAGRLEEAGEPLILAYWHEQVVLSVRFLRRRFLARRRPLAVVASKSRDGELVARIAARFDVRVVRGSSSRGGREALRALHREIARNGASLVILPDGPRGPRHDVKPGVIVLSQLTGCAIVPMAFAASSRFTLRSWDQLVIPRPGCRVHVVAGEPLRVPRELTDETREHHRLALASELADLNEIAERAARGR